MVSKPRQDEHRLCVGSTFLLRPILSDILFQRRHQGKTPVIILNYFNTSGIIHACTWVLLEVLACICHLTLFIAFRYFVIDLIQICLQIIIDNLVLLLL